jgi:hypothetical protein
MNDRVLNGVSLHPWDMDTPYFNDNAYFELLNASGVGWIRVDMVNPSNEWDSNRIQFLIDQTEMRGTRVLGILSNLIIANNPRFTLADWKSAVSGVVELFGNEVDAWEIWNEPNHPPFHLGQMDGTPEQYFILLKSAYEIIKSETPHVPVLFGGIAPTENAQSFFTGCWNLGADNYCDAVAYHIYNPPNTVQLTTIASLASPKPLWITEIGADSLTYDLIGQSQELLTLRNLVDDYASTCRIHRAFWYCWMDYAKPTASLNVWGDPVSKEDFFGLVTVDLQPKPAYDIFR